MTTSEFPVRVTDSPVPGRSRWLRWFCVSIPATPPPPALTQSVTFEQIDETGACSPVEAELQYNVRDPYAVTIVFMTALSPVPWRFGRDILARGLYTPAGDGDVHAWPCRDSRGRAVEIIELVSLEEDVLVQAPAAELIRFLDRTTAAVAPGSESAHLDIDAIIAALLDVETA